MVFMIPYIVQTLRCREEQQRAEVFQAGYIIRGRGLYIYKTKRSPYNSSYETVNILSENEGAEIYGRDDSLSPKGGLAWLDIRRNIPCGIYRKQGIDISGHE